MTAFAFKGVWLPWWRALVGAAVAAPLFLALGYCEGQDAQRAAHRAEAAAAKLAAEQRGRTADSNFNAQRSRQATAAAADRKEVDDATATLPDQAPSARQRARACLELRRQAARNGLPGPAC